MNGYLDPSARPPQHDENPQERPRCPDPAGLPAGRAPAGWVHLDTVDRNIVAQAAVTNPLLGQLLTEDLCWSIAYADWQSRAPGGGRNSAWQQEGLALERKRRRILELAASFNISPAPPAQTSRMGRLWRLLRQAS